MDRVEPSDSPDTGGDTGEGAATGGRVPAGSTGRLVVAVLTYVGARLLLVAVVAGVLVLVGLPVIVALLIGLIITLPLSLVLFRGLRNRLNAEIEAATVERRERREQLRSQLRGDE